MALFAVYVIGPYGILDGWALTQSEEEASEEYEKLSKEGYDAWYEKVE